VGGEYTDTTFQNFCSTNGIFHQFSCPHTHQQNGVAKRKHRHIVDTALALISQSNLPLTYWPYSFATSVFLINKLPTETLNLKSPWEVLFGTTPTYTSFKTFGCSCYPLLRPYNKHKLDFRSKECAFLGYASHLKGYLCLDTSNNKLLISRNVVFDENTFPFLTSSPTTPTLDIASPTNSWLSSLLYFTTCCQPSVLGPGPTLESLTSPACPTPAPSLTALTQLPIPEITQTEPIPTPPVTLSPSASALIPTTLPSSSTTTTSNIHPMQTRLKLGITKKKAFHTHTYTPDYLDTKPSSFTVASSLSPWVQAMEDEFSALHRQQTWTLVPPDPSQNVIGCKWVYKVKRNSDGIVSRYKARLVAKGFHQQPGIDYDETFSLVMKPTTVRIILTLAAQFQWPLRQLDISNAFLHGYLKEDVDMSQPQGFTDPSKPGYVCKLHKSLYGLKQAPRTWFERFTTHLLSLGFTASTTDPSLFVFHLKNAILYLLLYVDDIIITKTSLTLIIDLISTLQNTFELKDLGPLH
jgi:hypothetical protein